MYPSFDMSRAPVWPSERRQRVHSTLSSRTLTAHVIEHRERTTGTALERSVHARNFRDFENGRASNLANSPLEDEGLWRRACRSAKSREPAANFTQATQRQKRHKSLTLKLVRGRHYDIDDVALNARSSQLTSRT